MSFDYLIRKIQISKMKKLPFSHIEIKNFFSKNDFSRLIASKEIKIDFASSDEELFDALFNNGYKIINFPGCIINKRKYINWHKNLDRDEKYNSDLCEGFGMTLRLTKPQSAFIKELNDFLNGTDFKEALAMKFNINLNDVHYDAGIQKYLDGYEISPHPDIRKKALTYMVNINPDNDSENIEHHTQYLKFKEAFKYVQTYWEYNQNQDRCWVPWEWCEKVKVQNTNNSIVIFSPGDSTIHGVKAKYNHLNNQRTQLYGNLWYNNITTDGCPQWKDFLIKSDRSNFLLEKMKALIPAKIKSSIVDKMQEKGVIVNRLKK